MIGDETSFVYVEWAKPPKRSRAKSAFDDPISKIIARVTVRTVGGLRWVRTSCDRRTTVRTRIVDTIHIPSVDPVTVDQTFVTASHAVERRLARWGLIRMVYRFFHAQYYLLYADNGVDPRLTTQQRPDIILGEYSLDGDAVDQPLCLETANTLCTEIEGTLFFVCNPYQSSLATSVFESPTAGRTTSRSAASPSMS